MPTHARTNDIQLQPGFRLHHLEVRNWGTFDEKIHILDAGGQTALLIGENGSGKSTLVDALLTLLVPYAKRSYNLSAGGLKKRERDERTYVLGAFGSESVSEESRSQTKFLRRVGSPPTVLLACFLNTLTDEAVTVAQVLWIQDDKVKKLYLISRSPRSIQVDFEGIFETKMWKKAFKQRGFDVEDSFSDYAEKVVRHLRMESVTTLALFNQTVAIKEITHVSSFIREHMLERLDTRELMDRLEHRYEDLTKCHDAIQRARKQLELLKPVADKASEIHSCQTELNEAIRFHDALPACFALRLKGLLESEIQFLVEALLGLEREIAASHQSIDRLKKDEFSLQRAIESDEVGKQLARVEEELRLVVFEEAQRRTISNQYHTSLKALDILDEVTESHRFEQLHQWGDQEQQKQTVAISEFAETMAVAGHQLKELKRKLDEIENELRSLRSRPDLIPEEQRRLREFISEGACVDVGDLPFAGELMDVREEHHHQWRGALERLLRGFGLSILVPEKIYSRVNGFINDHNLRRRVVYHRVPTVVSFVSRGTDQGRVIEKMKLKQDHPLAPWVESELRSQFNHRCCDTVQEFERVSGFAITKQGLIRGGGTRHVKDDSHDIQNARFHILGWSNRDKIRRLEEDQSELQTDAEAQAVAYSQAQLCQLEAQNRASQAGKLAGFRSFSEIDWHSASVRKLELQARYDELRKSSNQIRQLQDQLEKVRKDIDDQESKRNKAVESKGGLQTRLEEYRTRLSQCERTLQACIESDLHVFDDRFDALLATVPDTNLTLSEAPVAEHKVESKHMKEILGIQGRREEAGKAATKFMERFLGEYQELKADLSADMEYLPEFLKLRQSIETDDLPRHEEGFRELMSRDVLTNVVSFQDELEGHCEEIESKINNLNQALRSIPYSAKTYIAIQVSPTTDSDIREFRSRLKSCLEFGLNADAVARESAFFRITELINRIREKPDWAIKVVDTRNWLKFAVEERRRDDNSQENFYDDTGGKSGGQKAKLAFTILASAIAYQYGIVKNPENPDSFRFVVVDEMFARSDEANSRYALQLFARFHLQLLIVCPFDARARVVEPFVSGYHLTLNPTTQASSVRTITVEEVHEQLAKLSSAQVAHVDA